MLRVLIFFVVWMAIGFIATEVSGRVLCLMMMKRLQRDKNDCERTIAINCMEKGKDPTPSVLDLLWNDLIWPYAVYLAIKGYYAIIRKEKEKNGES